MKLFGEKQKLEKEVVDLEQTISVNMSDKDRLNELNLSCKKELEFYRGEARWASCFDDIDLSQFVSYQNSFQIDVLNAGPVGLYCNIEFYDENNLITKYNGEQLISCSIGNCQIPQWNYRGKYLNQECKENLSQFITELSVFSQVYFVLGEALAEEKSEEPQYHNYIQGNNLVHELTFFSDYPLNKYPKNKYGKYTLLITTFDEVKEELIKDYAEEIIDAVSFPNLQVKNNQCFMRIP